MQTARLPLGMFYALRGAAACVCIQWIPTELPGGVACVAAAMRGGHTRPIQFFQVSPSGPAKVGLRVTPRRRRVTAFRHGASSTRPAGGSLLSESRQIPGGVLV